MFRCNFLLLIVGLVLGLGGGLASGLDGPQDKPRPRDSRRGAADESRPEAGQRGKPGGDPSPVAREHEAAARAFVEQHHPELGTLLDYLKQNQPAKYRMAVRNLFRTWERLAQLQQRDPERHQLEVAGWSAKSRADLLAAQLKMNDSPELREQLRRLVAEQLDNHLAILKLQQQRQRERLERLDKQVQAAEANRDEQVERRLRQLLSDRKRDAAQSNSERTDK